MANGEWFYAQNNQQQGPVALAGLQDLLRTGQLQPTDLVWRAGMPNWVPAAEVPEVTATPHAPAAPAAAPQAGNWQQPQAPYPPQPQAYYAAPGTPGGYVDPSYAYGSAGKSYNGMAITSFVLSLVGLIACGVVLGVVAIVLGGLALNGMKASGNNEGRGLSIAGIVIGVIDIIAGALIVLYFIGQAARVH